MNDYSCRMLINYDNSMTMKNNLYEIFDFRITNIHIWVIGKASYVLEYTISISNFILYFCDALKVMIMKSKSKLQSMTGKKL